MTFHSSTLPAKVFVYLPGIGLVEGSFRTSTLPNNSLEKCFLNV